MNEWKSRRFFRRLSDRDLLRGTEAFPLIAANTSRANAEVKRRAAIAGLTVVQWLECRG